jgi:hypothetical protein
MMERHMQLRQLDLLMAPDGVAFRNERLDARNRTEITSLLKLLLNECVATAKEIEAANEQDHS